MQDPKEDQMVKGINGGGVGMKVGDTVLCRNTRVIGIITKVGFMGWWVLFPHGHQFRNGGYLEAL